MNQVIFYYLNSLAGKSVCFDSLVVFATQYLPYLLALGFILILICSKYDKVLKIKIFLFSTLSVFLSRIVMTEIIRFFYFVPRPFVNNAVHQLIFHETSGSFPSGHAAFFFALAMAIYFFHKKWSIVFFIGAILISVARVIAGIHWLIDIFWGAIIGILSAWLVYKIFQKIYNPVRNGE